MKPGTSISGQTVNLSVGGCDTNIRYTGGFEQRSTADYQYDANGNLTKDPNKKINITYNHLNLPYLVSWYEDGIPKQIEWLYDATGLKLQKIVKKNSVEVSSIDYFGSIEYRNDTLDKIYHSEGYAEPNGSSFEYIYFLRDHLGTPRITFKNDGGSAAIVSEFTPYPFGAPIAELSKGIETNDHTYNEKELENDFGLDWFDYENRQRGLWNPHWNQIDPLADTFSSWSPYNFSFSNPVRFLDADGKSADDIVIGENDRTRLFNQLQSLTNDRLDYDPSTGEVFISRSNAANVGRNLSTGTQLVRDLIADNNTTTIERTLRGNGTNPVDDNGGRINNPQDGIEYNARVGVDGTAPTTMNIDGSRGGVPATMTLAHELIYYYNTSINLDHDLS